MTARAEANTVWLPFPRAAQQALGNSTQRGNLRHATSTIRAKREQVVSEVPDWDALREAGARIKDRALRHLDTHLEALEANVTVAGGHVHWARDADEACRIVRDLVLATGHSDVVKVKSMATWLYGRDSGSGPNLLIGAALAELVRRG